MSYKLEIDLDSSPISPRNEDFQEMSSKMICFHRRHKLGDHHDIDHGYFSGWDEMEEYLIKERGAKVILPLYLYDHSGITISTTPFSCPWDSGQIGFIYIDSKGIDYAYGYKRLNDKRRNEIINHLIKEVEVYDHYLRGDVYTFDIIDDKGETIHSCGGFFGSDHNASGLLDHAAPYLSEVA